MFANARMYSVSAEAARLWRELFTTIAGAAAVSLEVIDYPPPAPLPELWRRTDKAAVFMCGLPYSLSRPRPALIAAPVPAAADYQDRAVYWSAFVVRKQSPYARLEDVFGGRIAFTTTDSQSGFAAPLRYLSSFGKGTALFEELVAPQQTPVGALRAVVDGVADVAPVDSYALDLMLRHSPQLAAQIRVVAGTEPRPIPPLIGSAPNEALSAGFASAHLVPATAALMAQLQLRRFERPRDSDYNILSMEFETTLNYWRTHRLAERIHPAFATAWAAPANS